MIEAHDGTKNVQNNDQIRNRSETTNQPKQQVDAPYELRI